MFYYHFAYRQVAINVDDAKQWCECANKRCAFRETGPLKQSDLFDPLSKVDVDDLRDYRTRFQTYIR